MPGFPPSEARAETSISGADVPKPTMIMPTRSLGMPKRVATADEPSTNLSALHIRRYKPTRSAMPKYNKFMVFSGITVMKGSAACGGSPAFHLGEE